LVGYNKMNVSFSNVVGAEIKRRRLKLTLLFFLFWSAGCQQNEKLHLVNRYQYFDAGIDDIPPSEKIEAILLSPHYHPELFYSQKAMYLIGNPETVEEIVGHEIFAQKVIDDQKWIWRITTDFKNAKRTKKWSLRGYFSDARAVFVTRERAYMVLIDWNDEGDNKVVCGPNYQSEQLRKDFEEIGFLSKHRKPPEMSEVIKDLK
jgi:hypothetical protein